MLLYRSCRAGFRGFFRLIFRWEVIGVENIPAQGGIVLCTNHTSNWDPPFVGSPLTRMVHFMAKAELFSIPVFGWGIRKVGAFPVKRGGVSKESIKLALQLLKDGNILAVFPEGSRSNAGGMGKKGAAMLALKSGATVIPAAIIGGYKPFRRTSVIYGKPVDLSEFEQGGSEQLEAATEKILMTIRKMVQEKQMQESN
jgi:1-acyl-sn-glycerol-3-phosphate acyltransferase